ncbi:MULTISPECIES: hypothetical protein [Klebsiella]|uniref:hypothetical protein n=1 Tax=Klebsiella TaxID=570 RepID=UPI001E4AD7F7|nr:MULTISPECIES: hypothetical protein [Klebsiella]MEC6161734.1 hypothetical protein [Klebsiella grimontii]UHD02037.1 hypothetical protein LUW96_13785 [Klebsiella pasteurii]
MTKSTITRERLEKIKSWRETYGAGSNVMLPAEEAEELARIALAAMPGEPFAYIIQDKYERERGVEGHLSRSHVSKYVSQEDINEHEITCTPLYRHAQPAPVVVDERAAFNAWNNDIDCPLAGRDAKSAAWLAWNYRAMLQSGNSPVIPEGYVMVPKEPTAEMIWAAKYCFTSTPGWDVFKSAYKAMLAAAPQEVNHG